MRAETETMRACRAMPMPMPTERRARCRSLGFLPACRAQAQALLLIIRVLDALFLVSAARPTHSAHGAVEGLKMRCGFVAAPRAVVASLQPREQSGGGLENALWLRCSPASRF